MAGRPRDPIYSTVDTKPSKSSIAFAGRFISLRAIGRVQGIDYSHLSRAFRGERSLSMIQASKVAAALGMGIDDFYEAFYKHLAALENVDKTMLEQHLARISAEDEANAQRILHGKVPVPSLPGLRA